MCERFAKRSRMPPSLDSEAHSLTCKMGKILLLSGGNRQEKNIMGKIRNHDTDVFCYYMSKLKHKLYNTKLIDTELRNHSKSLLNKANLPLTGFSFHFLC